MNLNNAGTKDFKKPASLEAGTYPCRTVGIVDIGLQPQSYKGEEKAPGRMVYITYEFTDEFLLDEEGQEDKTKPRWLSEKFVLYNMETERAKSTARYNALDPTNSYHGDFLALVDIPIDVTVVQSPNKKAPDYPYNNIAAVSTMKTKDVKACPPLVNECFVFDLEEPDLDSYAMVPGWIRKQVESNLEFKGSALEAMLEMVANPPPVEIVDEAPMNSLSKEQEQTEPVSTLANHPLDDEMERPF